MTNAFDRDVDPAFPSLHGRPSTGWINDPNGCSRIDGVWHVFYQYNPSAPLHRDIHWGHMSSTDLVNWTTEPIALEPIPDGADARGCWSGCVVDDDGTPTAVFTGIDSAGVSSTLLARSDRSMKVFSRDPASVAGMPANRDLSDVRDPYVFVHAGRRYALQGAGNPQGTAEVLLYACDDLTRWTELGTFLRADHQSLDSVAFAAIWECPSIVPIGDSWLLIVSLSNPGTDLVSNRDVAWILGEIEREGELLAFRPQKSGLLDRGDAFFAAQAIEVDGRVMVWAWSPETDRGSERIALTPWQGVITFPREIVVSDDAVTVRPAGELSGLRHDEIPIDNLSGAFELVGESDAEFILCLDGRPCWPVGSGVNRVFVDGSLVEAFGSGGTGWTTRAYPQQSSVWTVKAGLLADLRAYRLALTSPPGSPPTLDSLAEEEQ